MQNNPQVQLTPECNELLKQVQQDTTRAPTGRSTEADVDVSKAMNRFKSQCTPLLKNAAQDAVMTMNKGDIDQLLSKLGCTDKQRLYNERKSKLASLGNKDQELMAGLALNIKNNC